MNALATILILGVGIVNLLPVTGVVSAAQLEMLYGLRLEEPDVLILMRHRAVLFGIVGGLVVLSAFHPPLRLLGIGVGLLSMLSFVVVALLVGGYNAELQRVVAFDLGASLALLVAGVLSCCVAAGRAEA